MPHLTLTIVLILILGAVWEKPPVRVIGEIEEKQRMTTVKHLTLLPMLTIVLIQILGGL
jgi:ABC-type dipeptide/oligopeptide/nickel transport system permease component